MAQRFCRPMREGAGGKPARTGGDVAAAVKERPEEAPFAALRQHGFRLRTWSRRPAAKPTRPKYHYIIFTKNSVDYFLKNNRTFSFFKVENDVSL